MLAGKDWKDFQSCLKLFLTNYVVCSRLKSHFLKLFLTNYVVCLRLKRSHLKKQFLTNYVVGYVKKGWILSGNCLKVPEDL
jgi:hypothetical protein